MHDIIYSRRINRYSTTSTSELAYIIGGYHTKEIKNECLESIRSFKKGRHAHVSISLGDETSMTPWYNSLPEKKKFRHDNTIRTMIIGGFSSDSRWVIFCGLYLRWKFFQCSWDWDLELDKWESQKSKSNSAEWSVRLWNRPGSFRFL